MDGHRISMLGTGLIGDFYTMTLHGQRGRDRVRVVYSRSEERGTAFRERWGIEESTTDLAAAVDHPDTDVVVVALPNFLHEEAIAAVAKAGKAVLCTKPLGRTAEEARRMLAMVEDAGIFAGYLEDLVYTPKTLKAIAAVESGAIGDVTWVRSRETHPGPHSAWFWDGRLTGGGPIIDLGCHCIEIIRNFVGKGNRPVDVMCHTDTLVHPIADEDNAIALIRFESGAIGQFEVSWTFRGGMDLRDEIAGTHGTIWLNHFLRTGFEMFTAGGSGGGYVAEKAETGAGWLFPVGDEVSELGYVDMFTDQFRALDGGSSPRETFYDGYVVNAIMDACYRSAKSRSWEPIDVEWRGGATPRISSTPERYEGLVVIKREILPDGRHKLILKDEASGDFTDRVVAGGVTPGRPALDVLPAAAWADHVADLLVDRLRDRPELVVCLPTGSTPLPVYGRLPGRLSERGVTGARATLVLLDEYLGLLSDHQARCDRTLERTVLGRLEPPRPAFVAFDVDGLDPTAACAAFDRRIAAHGGLDLVVLGLGRNGHVGMNEPGSPADAPTRLVELTPASRAAAIGYGADPPPTHGVTLGMAGILAAREIWLLATGPEKAEVLAAALDGPETPDVPASLLRHHPGVRVIADDPAAVGLIRNGTSFALEGRQPR